MVSSSDFRKIYNDLNNFPSLQDVCNYFKVGKRTIQKWVLKFRSQGVNLVDRTNTSKYVPPEPEAILNLKRDNLRLKEQLKITGEQLEELERQSVSNDKLMSIIHGVPNLNISAIPEWLTYRTKSNHGNSGIPTLFLSDLHFDEVVDPAQVEFLNKYNREIAIKRIRHTFDTALDLLLNKMHNPSYSGAVIALGGDLLSGVIHDELAETNDSPILKSLHDLSELLIEGITAFADAFKKVFVPCVVGNHGRLHKKPRCKFRVQDNYEWLIYQLLAKHFKNDSRVQFSIPESSDCSFHVFNKRYLLTHGDQFKGGNGISGIFTPLMLGRSRKQARQSAVDKSFDVLMVGHFHQYIHTEQLIVNGTTKGLDEYAYLSNFGFERPQQALWITHPDYGITMRMPILCDSYSGGNCFSGKNAKVNWLNK